MAPNEDDTALDAAPLELLREYASLAGGRVEENTQLLVVHLPSSESQFFRGHHRLTVARTVEALSLYPEAEVLVAGSDLLERLVAAIRARVTRRACGLIPPALSPSDQDIGLNVPVRDAAASPGRVTLSKVPVGQLVVRILLRTGATVEERLVRSRVVDLVHGEAVTPGMEQACLAIAWGQLSGEQQEGYANVQPIPQAPPDQLIGTMLKDLQAALEPEIARQRSESAQALALELQRLGRYYSGLLADAGGQLADADTRRAILREAQKRKEDEESRHALRAVVHPLMLYEWAVLAERAEWTLRGSSGTQGSVSATRWLWGDGAWTLRCPGCHAVPATLGVCSKGHVACDSCSSRCTVCQETVCRPHGGGTCHLDQAPLCDRHQFACPCCDRRVCPEHAGTCGAGQHEACSSCLGACAHCGMLSCPKHGLLTSASSPRGARRLCQRCVVQCEGGANEAVGVDEVVGCATCTRMVCERHQATCAVDGKVHCSTHLRRADRSRRLVCEKHRASCALEAAAFLATDEVVPCATCGRTVCGEHGGECVADRTVHCCSHLVALAGGRGEACGAHHVRCHVDTAAYLMGEVSACPVCAKPACQKHLRKCGSCQRGVCSPDSAEGRCRTCRGLRSAEEPDDLVIAAAIAANLGEPPRAKTWRTAQDARHTVVELDLGWRRRLVFGVRHGDSSPEFAIYHTLLGKERRI